MMMMMMVGCSCCCVVASRLNMEQHMLQIGGRCEVVLHGYETSPVCLLYTIATVLFLRQSISNIYHGSEMRSRKPEFTLLLT